MRTHNAYLFRGAFLKRLPKRKINVKINQSKFLKSQSNLQILRGNPVDVYLKTNNTMSFDA